MRNDLTEIEKFFERLSISIVDIIDLIKHAVFVADLDGNILFWNKGCEQIFGYNKGEILYKSAARLYPESRKNLLQEDLQTIISGKSVNKTWPALHKNGSIVWIDARMKVLISNQGEPEAILGSACNIQEQKNLETNLQESEARAKAILDNTVEAIITINTEGIIQSFNKKAEKMFGYSQDEIIGENVKKLMPKLHRENHDQYLENYLQTGEKKIIGIGREDRAVRKDGSVFPIELSVSEVTWDGSKIFTGIIRDISRRRNLESKILRISEEERRRIGKELHDGLGQMLTGIGLISRNLAKKLEANGLPGADEVQEISDMIKEADEYTRSLSHGLVPMEVGEEAMKDALAKLAQRAQRLFKIECEFIENGSISVEKEDVALHLYRIAQEAINNAVKHGGANHIKLILKGNEHSIEFKIIDNGTGLSDSIEIHKKQGLGIYTMQFRTHLLGGRFEIKREDGWTRVICTIPNHS